MTIYSGRAKLLIMAGMAALSWLGAGLLFEAALHIVR